MKHNTIQSFTLSLLLVVGLLLSGCNSHAGLKPEQQKKSNGSAYSSTQNDAAYKVVGVKDGDTFVLLMDGKEQVVRLAHVDCPEKKQPFGSRAKQFASDRCFGKSVTLIHNNKYDRNRRLIAEVIMSDGSNVNQELVKNGLAWHYKKYSKDTVYARLEIEARENKTGLWAEPNPVAPWNWRKR